MSVYPILYLIQGYVVCEKRKICYSADYRILIYDIMTSISLKNGLSLE